MLKFLIDNIFVSFGGTLFQQVVGIPMGTMHAFVGSSKQKIKTLDTGNICTIS
jgi:hypothetical protein